MFQQQMLPQMMWDLSTPFGWRLTPLKMTVIFKGKITASSWRGGRHRLDGRDARPSISNSQHK